MLMLRQYPNHVLLLHTKSARVLSIVHPPTLNVARTHRTHMRLLLIKAGATGWVTSCGQPGWVLGHQRGPLRMAVGKRLRRGSHTKWNTLHYSCGSSGVKEHCTAGVQTETGPALPAMLSLSPAIQAGGPGGGAN